jgi:hypothetical protein
MSVNGDSREDAIRRGCRTETSLEVLDLGHHRILITGPDQIVHPRQLDVLGGRNLLGQMASVLRAKAGASRPG